MGEVAVAAGGGWRQLNGLALDGRAVGGGEIAGQHLVRPAVGDRVVGNNQQHTLQQDAGVVGGAQPGEAEQRTGGEIEGRGGEGGDAVGDGGFRLAAPVFLVPLGRQVGEDALARFAVDEREDGAQGFVAPGQRGPGGAEGGGVEAAAQFT